MKSPKATTKKTTKTPTKSSTKKPATKAKKTELPVKEKVAAEVTKTTTKKPSPKKKAVKKTQTVASNPVVGTEEKSIPDRIGSTAGIIWHYLTENGTTPVAKLLREITEDEKIIQRSIGWLAQEGKITLDTSGRGETITLDD